MSKWPGVVRIVVHELMDCDAEHTSALNSYEHSLASLLSISDSS